MLFEDESSSLDDVSDEEVAQILAELENMN
jgi:hypothetical protein